MASERYQNQMEPKQAEDVDEELQNAELYEESMMEIMVNDESRRNGEGHDTDPFDRSNEYDADVDLYAPAAPTPDIPENQAQPNDPTTSETFGEASEDEGEELEDEVYDPEGDEPLNMMLDEFPIQLMTWKKWVTTQNPHYMQSVERYKKNPIKQVDPELMSKLLVSTNVENVEMLEVDLLAAELAPGGVMRPILTDRLGNVPEVVVRIASRINKEESIEDCLMMLRLFAVVMETMSFKKEDITSHVRHFRNQLLAKQFSEMELKILLPLQFFCSN